MEVKPVVAVVTQKLVDTLNEESIADNKVMIHQLKGIQKSLEKLRSFSKEKDHLRVVYEIEDEIEKFTFRVARQRKRFCFLTKHTFFFFNNVNSCCKLKRKIKKIRSTISSYRDDEASITSTTTSTPTSSSSTSTVTPSLNSKKDEEDNDDGDDAFCNGTDVLTQKSSSDIWPILEIPSTPSPKRGWMTRSFSTITNQKEHGLQRKKLTFSFSYNEEEKSMVGFKQLSNVSYQEEVGVFGQIDDIKSLVRRLTQQTELFVPIVGDAGCGKTTLARAVYRNRKIRDHFESHDWISVTEDYDVERVLLSVSKKVATVKGKRYLIVVDGVGSCVLKDLKNAFPDENNGSKVIFISRTGPEMSMNSHIVKNISEEESWTMFLKKAGKEKEAEQIQPRVKDKILYICKGLPLNIVLMAGLMTKRPTRWAGSLTIDHDQHSDDVLNLCYNDLTINSKLCLLYMSLFPKDYDIPVRRLLRLWLAEGFVKRRSQRSKHPLPEDLVQKCFEELVDRNIIQITKLRSDNSPRQCRLVSVFHDYLLPKAQDISLFYIHRNSENYEDAAGTFGVRRMVQHLSTTGAFDHQQSQRKSPFDPSLLRSYISFNFQHKDMPEREVGILLCQVISRNFSLLRVLDLEGVCQPSLPNKLGHLRHLRYLGLRWTFLETIPESVGDLSNLETLDVKHTRVDTLPDSIWKLKRLRHLNLNNIRLAMPPSSSLTLLTLWGLVLDEKISINQGLGKLLDLRELGIKFRLSLSESQGALLDWIVKLVNLQQLRLTSVDDMGQPSKLVLKPLTALDKLSHLNLYGSLQKLPDLNEFPPTVKVLTLSLSLLNNDPMETLEQLPCLIVLRLLGDSFTGKRMVCHGKGFKKLEVLKLWKLTGLEEWDVEDEAMTSLKQLDIRCCHKLKNISSRLLLKPRRLEELELTDMPDDFVARIKKRKSNDTSLTINPWKFNK